MLVNYPVKYAVMPILEQPCYGNNYERPTRCYIVTKCYVLKENIEYNYEGFKKKSYIVQCPYIEEIIGWKRAYVTVGESFVTDKVYDSFMSATKGKLKKNKELIESFPYYNKKQHEEYVEDYCENQKKYDELERLIEENTPDLVVNNAPRKQKFIYTELNKKDGNGRMYRFETGYSLYDGLFEGQNCKENYIAYSVSKEEYDEYKKTSPEDYERFTHTPLLMHKANSKIVTLTNGDKLTHLSSIDYEVKAVKPDEDLTFDEPGIIIFTLETYDDIVNSYNLNKGYKKTLEFKK